MSAASGSLLQVKYVVFWLACFHANSVSAIREQAKKDSSVDPLMVCDCGGNGWFVYDNLYNDEITVVVVSSVRPGLDPKATAQKIADLARSRAVDQKRQSPFAAAAQEAGCRFYGGKLDDITAVVSYVTPASKAKHRSTADSSSFCFCQGNN
ncbi:hypothetical protein F2Q68_00012602 [Brassica cretica]|uniref:Protein phosphatase n=1 Tax=Brassica cretica TaxID=69181 RepID=A0A3N6RJN5_BRACR|nr:hypothetical protein F2Q68_00012602 [Brassica cretica]